MEEKEIYKANILPVIISIGIPFLYFLFIISQYSGLKAYYKIIEFTFFDFILAILSIIILLNLILCAIRRKITVSSSGIYNVEAPVFFVFHYSNKIASKLAWADIKALRTKEDLLFKRIKFFYIIGKNGKFIAFSPDGIKNGKNLISSIEDKMKKKFEVS